MYSRKGLLLRTTQYILSDQIHIGENRVQNVRALNDANSLGVNHNMALMHLEITNTVIFDMNNYDSALSNNFYSKEKER